VSTTIIKLKTIEKLGAMYMKKVVMNLL